MRIFQFGILIMTVIITACTGSKKEAAESEIPESMFTGAKNEVKLITLDPGHFHAALVQKEMYDQVDPTVYVYAPEGPDVQDHLEQIEAYNTREKSPTSWVEKVYTGDDYLEQMLAEKPGNVMVTAGNNAKKTEYILKTIQAGIHVLADKPMVIFPEEFPTLEKAFQVAGEKGVLLYDIMTERYEITTILQRELSQMPGIFGTLEQGTVDDPAITKESVHHLFKYVSGSPLKRPAWFFDVNQQGQGMADVGTHLVDLIQWEAFPEEILSKEEVEIISARKWDTELTPQMFKKVTGMDEFPGYLSEYVEDDVLKYPCNGEMNYLLKGIHAKVSVAWNFEAPEGAGDTHYSIMRGSKCNVIIQQGEEEGFRPTLYVEGKSKDTTEEFSAGLTVTVEETLASKYPGLSLRKTGDNLWVVDIPEKYKVGHEAHFAQVTGKYLQYLVKGHLPEWEVPNMIVKYYTTTEALKRAVR